MSVIRKIAGLVAGTAAVALTLTGCVAGEGAPAAGSETAAVEGASGGGSQSAVQLGEGSLDGIEVGAVA